MKTVVVALLVLTIVASQTCEPCKAINHVCNPSFETPVLNSGSWSNFESIDSWTPVVSRIEIWNNLQGAARNGNQHLELSANSQDGIIQTINQLTVGTTYQINFAASCRAGTASNTFRVSVDGVQIGTDLEIGNEGAIIWHDQDGIYFFTATAESAVLQIEDPSPVNGSYGSLLDYVSVSPCGCPSGVVNTSDYDMSLDACQNIVDPCMEECYYVDEWLNTQGSHQCDGNCDCDGFRTCVSGWCTGDARPENSTCDIPDTTQNVVFDNSGSQTCSVVTFYSECDYTGYELQVTGPIDCLEWSPKSICIPRGKAVTVYDLCEFNGMDAQFETNISCIDTIDFDFLLESGITLSGKKNNLKTNSKKAENFKFEVKDL